MLGSLDFLIFPFANPSMSVGISVDLTRCAGFVYVPSGTGIHQCVGFSVDQVCIGLPGSTSQEHTKLMWSNLLLRLLLLLLMLLLLLLLLHLLLLQQHQASPARCRRGRSAQSVLPSTRAPTLQRSLRHWSYELPRWMHEWVSWRARELPRWRRAWVSWRPR